MIAKKNMYFYHGNPKKYTRNYKFELMHACDLENLNVPVRP